MSHTEPVSDEARLRAWLATNIGGTITRFEPLQRWRPSWEVDIDVSGATRRLHVRGDRSGGLSNRPLRREYDVLALFERHGIPVPKLYGWCGAPEAIVMENLPDTPFLGNPDNDPAVHAVVEEYASVLAAIHRLDVEEFAAAGVPRPGTQHQIAFDYLEFAEGIYESSDPPADALIAFVRRWLRRNAPIHRDRVVPLVGDAPQFFHRDGRITGIYDLELAKIGDPMLDLASMRVRDTYEPIGDVGSVIARYEAETDEPVDGDALSYYTALLFVAVPMIAGPSLRTVRPHPAYVEYLSWTVASSRGALDAIAEKQRFEFGTVETVPTATNGDSAFDDLIAQCELLPNGGSFRQAPALSLAHYVRRVHNIQSACDELELEECRALTGIAFHDREKREAALERFVMNAPPEHDEALARMFHRRTMRRLQLLSDYPSPIVERGLHPLDGRPFDTTP